jgi:hypothetical protein
MFIKYTKLAIAILAICITQPIYAQFQSKGLITNYKNSSSRKDPLPQSYQIFKRDLSEWKNELKHAGAAFDESVLINLPSPLGETIPFRVWKNTTLAPGFQGAFPEIHTYSGVARDKHNITAKIEIGCKGFYAMVFDGGYTYLIDPYSTEQQELNLVYYKSDYPQIPKPACVFGQSKTAAELSTFDDLILEAPISMSNTAFRTNGAVSKTYRLAIAATGEYTAFHGGTSAHAAAAIATTINRVNGIYERELAVSFTIIPQTASLIYTDAATDPYTNGNPDIMLYQNQSNITAVVGSGNYDIGHVFGTNSGGVAGLGVVCNNNFKSWGVTGSGAPIGDPFDIDYVAHEMGHQFGANHTFNSEALNCGYGSRSAADAYEPASGSTIMAYAGICAPENLQWNSDAYFHINSLDEIASYITTGYGATCALINATANTPSSYSNISATYSIPHSTPFELEAPAAVDFTADELLYCWEQMDLGAVGAWNTVTDGPLFRSITPSTSKVRHFPSRSKVLSQQLFSMGERLPNAARTMNFVLTVRDIYQGKGAFNNELNNKITVLVQPYGPFEVLYPNTDIQTFAGSEIMVNWSVANTVAAPINTGQVEIFLSLDNGATFPNSLGIYPNNGIAMVTIPANTLATSSARIKVKPLGNIFYQISPSVFTINAALPIALTQFDLNPSACSVVLDWKVASAGNFNSFEVQRAQDGRDFKTIGIVNYLEGKSDYQFLDKNIQGATTIYYRLKLNDSDASYVFSKVMPTKVTCEASNEIIVHPNPFQNTITIHPKDNLKSISVIDVTGREVFRKDTAEDLEWTVNLEALSKGHYYLLLKSEKGDLFTERIIKE